MSFLSKLFGNERSSRRPPDIEFGRFTSSYKTEAKYDHWDDAIRFFEEEKYMDAYRSLFSYLADSEGINVTFETESGEITFTVLQGSKRVTGIANSIRIKAEAKIARTEELNIGFMRRLIEHNYNLKYGRYCLDDDENICAVFDSITADASPYKVYYGLKEIALAADKQDDLLLDEFKMLHPINAGHIIHLQEEEKEVKLNFLRSKIADVLDYCEHGKINTTQYPGAITYLLIDTIYRLDFLIRPEGYTMEAFERLHRTFFSADGLSSQQKNQYLVKELRGLQNRSDEKIRGELYRTISTFGMLGATNHNLLKDIISDELPNMQWYQDNGYEEVALAIPGFIVGHSLFNYSLPEPDRELLMLYYQIMEPGYFEDLGFDLRYLKGTDLNKHEIVGAIQFIKQSWDKKYPDMNPDTANLDFSSTPHFAKSFLRMLTKLDLSKST